MIFFISFSFFLESHDLFFSVHVQKPVIIRQCSSHCVVVVLEELFKSFSR